MIKRVNFLIFLILGVIGESYVAELKTERNLLVGAFLDYQFC